MHPDEDESPLILTKWPFYLGDSLLVSLAITIAFLNNWELGGVQIFACVLAVALGAAILVLPFMTEYLMRVREEKEDRASEDRLFKKQLEHAEATLLKQQERLKQLESRSALDDQRYELLASAIDQKTQVELPDLAALTERIAAIEASVAKQVQMPDEFKKSFEETVNSLDALQSRLDHLEKIVQRPTFDPVKAVPEDSDEGAVSRKRSKKTDSSLLQRAIQEKQDTAAAAVSRIIDPGNESSTSDSGAKAMTTGSQKREDGAKVSEIELPPEDFSVSLDTDLMMDDDLFNAGEVDKPKKSKPKKAKKRAASKEMVFIPEKATTTIVIVSKLMGIGNKPFLRGGGAGLSWEKGLEMEFQEIGKWIWSAPSNLNDPVEIQVYSNDVNADRKGKCLLQPGQQLEITPEF